MDNGFIMGGYSYSSTGDRSEFNYGGLDYWVIKIDSGGRPIWDEHLGGKRDDYMQDMVLTPGDNIVLAGHSKSGKEFDRTSDTLNGAYDYWITKAYILLGDIFMQQKDYFNARATFESVAKNATIPELKNEAQQKYEQAAAEEKANSKIGG